MRIGTLSLAAITAAALLGCASPGTFKPMYFPGYTNVFIQSVQCPAMDCPPVPVTVIDDGTVCVLSAPDVIDVTAGGAHNVKWTITTDGYEFSKESYKYGIFIKSDPDDEFKNVQITADGKSLSLRFEHNHPGAAYSYALSVRRSSNKTFCKTLDPWFIT